MRIGYLGNLVSELRDVLYVAILLLHNPVVLNLVFEIPQVDEVLMALVDGVGRLNQLDVSARLIFHPAVFALSAAH